MDDKWYSLKVREIELKTGTESYVELNTFGLLLMYAGATLSIICLIGILILMRTSPTDTGDILVTGNLTLMLFVFLIISIFLLIIGTVIQMRDVVRCVRASQRFQLISELDGTKIDTQERSPPPGSESQ